MPDDILSLRVVWEFGAMGGGGDDIEPPAGFVFLADPDGALLLDDDGFYLVEAV